MNTEASSPGKATAVSCVKCEHENGIDAFRCHECGSHLYISCKHCGCLNLRTSDRCDECRTQLHQRGQFKWKRAKARRWIQPVSYALVALGSILTCLGVIKISQMDFSRSADEPIYITVDTETLERLQSR